MAVKVDINIGFLPLILRDPRLPVARIDKVDNTERDIVEMFLIVFTEQTPALWRPAQAVDPRNEVLAGAKRPHSPAASSSTAPPASHGTKTSGVSRQTKEQEGGNDQNAFAGCRPDGSGRILHAFLTNVQQFDLLGLFATNGGLCELARSSAKRGSFLKIFIQRMIR